jgi:hypothetical protein
MRLAVCLFFIALILFSGCTGPELKTVRELNATINETAVPTKSSLRNDEEASITIIDISADIQAFATFLKDVGDILS